MILNSIYTQFGIQLKCSYTNYSQWTSFQYSNFINSKILKFNLQKSCCQHPSLLPHVCVWSFSIGNSPWELAFSNLPLGNPWIAAFFFAMAFAFIATFDLWLGSTFCFFFDGQFHRVHVFQYEDVHGRCFFFTFFVFCTWSWWYVWCGTFGCVLVFSELFDPGLWTRIKHYHEVTIEGDVCLICCSKRKAPAWIRSKPDKLDIILIYVDNIEPWHKGSASQYQFWTTDFRSAIFSQTNSPKDKT